MHLNHFFIFWYLSVSSGKVHLDLFLDNCTIKGKSIQIRISELCNFEHCTIIPTQCFYWGFFRNFEWSIGKIKSFLHFHKKLCAGIFYICLDFTVVDCVYNNKLYIKL